MTAEAATSPVTPMYPEFGSLPRAVEWVDGPTHVLGDLAQFDRGGPVGGHRPEEIAKSTLYRSDLMRLRKVLDRLGALACDVRVAPGRSIDGFDCADRLVVQIPTATDADVTEILRGVLDLRSAPTDRVLSKGVGLFEVRYSLLSVVSLERPEWCEPG